MSMRYSSGFNLDKLRQNLFAKKGRFNKEMRQAALEGAEMIMEKSQSNSPVDTFNLEQAHHIKESFTRADHVRFTIEVSGIGFGSDDPRPVDSYAMEVHEHYDMNRMGPKSQAKADSGHDVGPKYLERAIESEKAKAVDLIRQAVRRNFKGRR
jgi:hypothetical protein